MVASRKSIWLHVCSNEEIYEEVVLEHPDVAPRADPHYLH